MGVFQSLNGNLKKNAEKKKRFNVKNTNSGVIHHSFDPTKLQKNNLKSSKSKAPASNKSVNKPRKAPKIKVDFNNIYGNVRLSVKAVARLDAYQNVNGISNRSDALNNLLDKVLPKALSDSQKNYAKQMEQSFENRYKRNSKQYKNEVKRLKKQQEKEAIKKAIANK